MKKTKLLFPILGAAAIAGSIAPALVSCGKQEFISVDVIKWAQNIESGTGTIVDLTLSNTQYSKGHDFVTTISWPSGANHRLYAYDFTLYVNDVYVRQNSKIYPDGYTIVSYARNAMTIKIPSVNFDNTEKGHRPVVDIAITLDASEANDIKKVSAWKNHYFTVGDLWCNALHTKDFEVTGAEALDPYSIEFEANLNKWGGGKKLPANQTIYLGIVDTSGAEPELVPIQEDGYGSVWLGQVELTVERQNGILAISAPSGGWGNLGRVSALTTWFDFYENHESLQVVLAETDTEFIKYDLSATYSSSMPFLASPEIGFAEKEFAKGQDVIAQIYWVPRGVMYSHLYAESISVQVNGKDLEEATAENPNGFSIMGHNDNAITVRIPAVNFIDGNKAAFHLQLEDCEIDNNLLLNEYDANYITYESQPYNALHSTGTGTRIVRGQYVEFEADLNKWADGSQLPPNELYIGLFDVSDPANKVQIPFQEIGRDVYIGQKHVNTEIDNGFIVISPEAAWGALGHLSTLTCYFEVANNHQKVELILGAPAA